MIPDLTLHKYNRPKIISSSSQRLEAIALSASYRLILKQYADTCCHFEGDCFTTSPDQNYPLLGGGRVSAIITPLQHNYVWAKGQGIQS